MKFTGVLTKMITEYSSPIQYYLELEDNFINVNQLLDKNIRITFERYQCLTCGKNKKTFRQGNCYDCFFKQPNVGEWIIKPELSKAHLDIEDRDLAYEKKVQLQPHIVYLALSGNVKVGVTRKPQVPTRWIDQGASKAIAIMETPNRYLAGITEVVLKKYASDKTNWQKMLKNDISNINLLDVKESIYQHIPKETRGYFLSENTSIYTFDYPVIKYPKTIKSHRLEKDPIIEGKLKGIKGQYLIFEDGSVFNIRNNEGSVISLRTLS